MINDLYSLYRKVEELESEIDIVKHLSFKSEEYITERLSKLEPELIKAKKTYEGFYNSHLQEIKTLSNNYLQTFLQDTIKFHMMPRYGLQGIFEDYRKDEIEDDENVELQYNLQRYYYNSYQNSRGTALENYRKILFILKLIGENK